MQYYYSNPNYVGYQQNGTTAQAVVPGSYPVNRVNAYNNPYCNVNAIPAQGSGGFVNPTQVSGMQQNFVGQITYAAPTNPMVMQEPVRDYYNWKLTNNIHPRTPDEEDYYCNYYNNTIYPAQVNAFRQQVAVSQYQNQNQTFKVEDIIKDEFPPAKLREIKEIADSEESKETKLQKIDEVIQKTGVEVISSTLAKIITNLMGIF